MATIELQLPENPRDWFFQESFNTAWPQILAYVGAIIGILTFIFVTKALTGRG